MNTTQDQKEILLQWMKLHPEVARGRLRRKGESKNEMIKLLQELSNMMNSLRNGPIKSGSEWFKTWKDWKMYVLKKETKRRNSSLRTGGGSPKQIHFSPLEENLIEFLTPEAAGLGNIPQGGIYFNETRNLDSQGTSNIIEIDYSEEHEQNENATPNITQHASKSTTFKGMINTFEGEKLQSMSDKMISIQKEKLRLKKEELNIQQQLLQVHRCTLSEIEKIRGILDTFGSLQ